MKSSLLHISLIFMILFNYLLFLMYSSIPFAPALPASIARITVAAPVVNKDFAEIELRLGELTDDERQIITDGCLINYYKYN